ncbi:MAG: DUF1870 family protein [Micrococcales bacterium]|nr:DUF1870 family protein [Micrococcales bacterium]
MDAAEYRALRELLGVTGDHLAGLLGVTPRQARKWEQGSAQVPIGVTAELGEMVDETNATVAKIVAEHPTDQPLTTYRTDHDMLADHPGTRWTASWHRSVVARAVSARPELQIVYADERPA